MENEKRRIDLDLTKLLAILLVCLRHSMQLFVTDYDRGALSNAIWLIQMPIFFLVSGALATKKEKMGNPRSFLLILSKKAALYLWPCVTFGFFAIFLSDGNFSHYGQSWIDFFLDPQTNLWFIWVLFLCVFFFDIGTFLSIFIRKPALSKIFPFLFSAVVFFAFTIPLLFGLIKGDLLGLKLFIFYFPFYCLGNVCHLFSQSATTHGTKAKAVSLIALVIAVVGFFFIILCFPSIQNFPDNSIKYLAVRVLGSLSGCYILYWICHHCPDNSFSHFASKGGAFTLECYYLQMLATRLVKVDFYLSSLANQWFDAIGFFMALVSGTIVVLFLMYYVPCLHLIIFGKPFSCYAFEKKHYPFESFRKNGEMS